ncbi:hypothetical protein BHE74_00030494 [Ensete ventricosum]|nr:hypothetical protein BHE74_00030494 [Ensete ventricosum]
MIDTVCLGQELEPAVVFEVIGEPAIVIDGVPPMLPGSSVPVCKDITGVGSINDPCFGEWLEGRKIRKLFGEQYYSGTVVKFDTEVNWYRVIYEDGDSEDLEWHELEEVLLPLDISIPLTTLAFQMCKLKQSAPTSEITLPRTRKGCTKKGRKKED